MSRQEIHEKYMLRCLELAAKGIGYVAPNPMVGAVVVHQDQIIGEGYHRKYGSAHAEPEAIASVRDKSLLKDSTLYVNLEPCSHFGQTPPCAQLIIDQKIPRVFVGGLDPYPEVCGRGISLLQAAGIEVTTGLLQPECEALNKRFLTFHRHHRPYIFLKWAQSADGFIDSNRTSGDIRPPVQFSGKMSRIAVHKMRAEESAILVGTRTALLDNPSLTVRYWKGGKHPWRILLDKDLRVPEDYHLLDGKTATLVFTHREKQSTPFIRYYRLNFEKDILPQMMSALYELKIQSLIVEGGTYLLNSFLSADLWDEMIVETSCIRLEDGWKAPELTIFPDTFHVFDGKSTVSSYANRKIPKIL
ncbi:MAG: bifunctional diaminohydroxyphosphoribosylaminopyrimidine deaminase/5-amino-6-(5-phosphoribosylamino)uracil reductase RibD [Dysgonamonadaceae bacterium]|jgi:diaminohydroxyphosphoribosylaminopyrimidine deaminase/5-amino-6-(5-phosphoribosylamino)uracil reductase|nr:bifunctional diaminohydroxyphosphoribosylaminopyrimidine deaminase/5-amino-6-(5-phosphoribosylamino)uracil reductase RibD [Dysgonamonadaceae bacterium]